VVKQQSVEDNENLKFLKETQNSNNKLLLEAINTVKKEVDV
jgi:hypothetical protein